MITDYLDFTFLPGTQLTTVYIIAAAGMIISYFAGNISPAIILGKIYGVDVRKEGSGNAGTTNVLRTVGKKAGAITLIIDILKGFIPTLAAGFMTGTVTFPMLCGICTVLGHMWPVLFGFKGGKGVATTFGFLLAAQPVLALILLGIVVVGILLTKKMSVSVICAVLFAVPIGYYFNHENLIWISIIAILILIKHKANIKRIISGTEPKVSFASRDKKNIQK